MHIEVSFRRSVVCPETHHPSFFQLIHQRLHVHTHIFSRVVGPWNYKGQEHVLSLHNGVGWEIERNNKHGPETVGGSRHTKRIEPICRQGNSHIPSLSCFQRVFSVESLPCITIRRMHHQIPPFYVFLVPSPISVPHHQFRSLLVHVKSLNHWYD